jgi:hypothetical protein
MEKVKICRQGSQREVFSQKPIEEAIAAVATRSEDFAVELGEMLVIKRRHGSSRDRAVRETTPWMAASPLKGLMIFLAANPSRC